MNNNTNFPDKPIQPAVTSTTKLEIIIKGRDTASREITITPASSASANSTAEFVTSNGITPHHTGSTSGSIPHSNFNPSSGRLSKLRVITPPVTPPSTPPTKPEDSEKEKEADSRKITINTASARSTAESVTSKGTATPQKQGTPNTPSGSISPNFRFSPISRSRLSGGRRLSGSKFDAVNKASQQIIGIRSRGAGSREFDLKISEADIKVADTDFKFKKGPLTNAQKIALIEHDLKVLNIAAYAVLRQDIETLFSHEPDSQAEDQAWEKLYKAASEKNDFSLASIIYNFWDLWRQQPAHKKPAIPDEVCGAYNKLLSQKEFIELQARTDQYVQNNVQTLYEVYRKEHIVELVKARLHIFPSNKTKQEKKPETVKEKKPRRPIVENILKETRKKTAAQIEKNPVIAKLQKDPVAREWAARQLLRHQIETNLSNAKSPKPSIEPHTTEEFHRILRLQTRTERMQLNESISLYIKNHFDLVNPAVDQIKREELFVNAKMLVEKAIEFDKGYKEIQAIDDKLLRRPFEITQKDIQKIRAFRREVPEYYQLSGKVDQLLQDLQVEPDDDNPNIILSLLEAQKMFSPLSAGSADELSPYSTLMDQINLKLRSYGLDH